MLDGIVIDLTRVAPRLQYVPLFGESVEVLPAAGPGWAWVRNPDGTFSAVPA